MDDDTRKLLAEADWYGQFSSDRACVFNKLADRVRALVEERDALLDGAGDRVGYTARRELELIRKVKEASGWEGPAPDQPNLWKYLGRLRAENAKQARVLGELEQDKARLDWLERQCDYTSLSDGFEFYPERGDPCVIVSDTLREAIDAALRQPPAEETSG